jgi:hypothetical protein
MIQYKYSKGVFEILVNNQFMSGVYTAKPTLKYW